MINFINIIIACQNQQKNIGKGLFKESNVNIQKNKKAEERDRVKHTIDGILNKKKYANKTCC